MYHNIAKIAWFNQFLSRIHLVRQQEKGFSVKQCPRFLISRWCILLSDFSLLENSIFFNVPQYWKNHVVQSIFIEDSSCQVARKGVFCEIVPRISGFQVVHTIVRLLTFGKQYFLQCTTILPKSRGSINFYRGFILSGSKKRGFLRNSALDFWFPGGTYYCQTSHFWKIVFSSMYHNIVKIAWFNQFLSRIHLVMQKEKGFSVKQCPGFLVSRWCILLSDFSLLENSIFFNVPQYYQNRVVQSIFIEDSSCQVARKGGFCEIVPRISGFQVVHTIVRLLTFGKQYFLQSTTILPKSRGSINFYRGFILSGSKKRGFL